MDSELRSDEAIFEEALLNGDRNRALKIVQTLRETGHTLIEIETKLIQPALYHIGQRWQDNTVSIAREHLATATAEMVMANALLQSSLPPLTGQKVLLACVEGNQHTIGLRMVSDAFELEGWDVQYLGANVPTHALVDHVQTWRPNVVGLSIASPCQLIVTRDAIQTIRVQLKDCCSQIIVGGLAINGFDLPLQYKLGADGYALDANAASNYARKSMQRETSCTEL